ncbi:MAG TPA: NAD(P)H-quinone oxidoreductase [Marisediminicola sp.]|jgi:putative PIG3 family NAD(P)H quinone oxidoreductase|nr:NAD(P)H-quinone oxidoreductase [Marisediminicola sp.]
MRAIVIEGRGGPETLVESELPDPVPADNEVLIKVAAAGVNRADIAQRQGVYPPPAGAPDWPGLEVSGTITALGGGVLDWSIGDEVCALLAGGGYASLAVARRGQLLPVPKGVQLADAAALPEAVATVWSNVFLLGKLRAGDTLLVHGGSSGIGTIAIQLARAFGCRVAVTAGSARKLNACERLGADILIDYRRDDFVERMLAATDGRGADVILDAIGGSYVDRDIRCLARHGRLLLIGNQSGELARFSIGTLLSKCGSIHGTTLRSRPPEEKDDIIESVLENVWPLLEARLVTPVIQERMPLADARRAHELMQASAHIGKLLLLP